jgi:hypothetical protein
MQEDQAMSVVTNVIVLTSASERHASIEEVNQWLAHDSEGNIPLARADTVFAGARCMECQVYVGAYNYLSVDGLLAKFRLIAWDFPDSVQVGIRGPFDELFTFYRVSGV